MTSFSVRELDLLIIAASYFDPKMFKFTDKNKDSAIFLSVVYKAKSLIGETPEGVFVKPFTLKE